MSKLRFRMLVSDIDGTLVNDEDRVGEANRAAVARLQAEGILVTLATGRTWGTTRRLYEQLQLRLPVIVCNGAGIYDPGQGRALFERTLDPLEALSALAALDDPAVGLCLVAPDAVYVSGAGAALADYLYCGDEPHEYVDDLRRIVRAVRPRILKLLAIAPHPGINRALRRLAAQCPQLNVVQSDPHALEVLPAGVSKGEALHTLCGILGCSPSRTVALGNAPNDLEMLRTAGAGIAVADAYPEVIAGADWVTLTSRDDALAHVADTFFFNPLRLADYRSSLPY